MLGRTIKMCYLKLMVFNISYGFVIYSIDYQKNKHFRCFCNNICMAVYVIVVKVDAIPFSGSHLLKSNVRFYSLYKINVLISYFEL